MILTQKELSMLQNLMRCCKYSANISEIHSRVAKLLLALSYNCSYALYIKKLHHVLNLNADFKYWHAHYTRALN